MLSSPPRRTTKNRRFPHRPRSQDRPAHPRTHQRQDLQERLVATDVYLK